MDRLDISNGHCTVERDGHVVIVTMNRPEAKNALSKDMLVGLAEAWAYISETPEVRVGILTGAGGSFCAGSDLKAMGSPSPDPRIQQRAAEIPDFHWRGLLREAQPTKPIISAVEGYAVAGGTELLIGTDLRVVAESARLGLFEAARGLFPMGGSVLRLPRQIGYAPAMEVMLTGRRVTPEEALSWGLINRIVPDGQALASARELAGQIAAAGPLAVQAILRTHRETSALPEAQGLAVSDTIGWAVMRSDDAKEGMAAFAERRPPVFTGR